jgi:hypothetical protein
VGVTGGSREVPGRNPVTRDKNDDNNDNNDNVLSLHIYYIIIYFLTILLLLLLLLLLLFDLSIASAGGRQPLTILVPRPINEGFVLDKFAVVQFFQEHEVAQWLRHCARSRKVAGSIPDAVNGVFHWHNPSGRTMALGSTQPLTEMSTRNISWG